MRLPSGLSRDIFLSHRSVESDKNFVRKLAADIESQTWQDRYLSAWVDEAELPPGKSVTGLINQGLENSRFIALVMTPDYFQSHSGWTDAEWHAALYSDPDNRRSRILPLLAADCPYVPILLRHLSAIDLRHKRYQKGLQELLRVLRDEPLPRPVTYRGQLVAPSGRIDRATLIAERAAPQASPDVISEHLYCNLLPVERLPQYIYVAPLGNTLCDTLADGSTVLPTKQRVKDAIVRRQEEANVQSPFVPAFRLVEGKIATFHDLDSPEGPFYGVIDEEAVEKVPLESYLQDEDDRNILVSLLHMSLDRHMRRRGLVIDETKQGRYFFPPKDGGPNVVHWKPRKKESERTVARPYLKAGNLVFWLHLAAYLRMFFLANKFYLKIRPTWVVTEDGYKVKTGPKVGRLVINWTGAERNLQILFHVRFWTSVLRIGPGPISIRAGDQRLELSTSPAVVHQAYGISDDQKDLMRQLDEDAPLLAAEEDELASLAVEAELGQPDGLDQQDESSTEEEEDTDLNEEQS